jgi:hypothetical protein
MPTPYFSQVPNFDYVSRDLEKNSLGDYTTVKNLFRRAKIRDDIFQSIYYFTRYTIVGDERPDNVAEKIYGDPTLDWIVLLSNNIQNVYDGWPKTQLSFDNYLLQKYGSYENISNIHHYETVEKKTRDGYIIVEGGKTVSEGYYNSPQYEIELDPNIVLPTTIPGIFAEGGTEVDIDSGTVTKLFLTNAGAGYSDVASVTISPPPLPRTAVISVELNFPPDDKEVGEVTIIDNGSGYTYQPGITFSDPKPTIPPVLEPVIGAGGSITSISILNPGDGYTFTPTITIDPPEDVISNAAFITDSNFTVASGFEGMFMDPYGFKVYTCHGANSYTTGLIEYYELSSSFDITSGTKISDFTLNIDGLVFQYLTGIEFKPDGTRMYVSGLSNSGFKIAQYDLSTEWDITTASLVGNVSFPATSGIRLQDDGTHAYILETTDPDTIKKYEMIIEWDITTLRPFPVQQTNINALTNESSIRGFSFKDDGTKLYVAGTDTNSLHVLKLEQRWDLNTFTLIGSLNIQNDSGDSTPLDTYTDPTETLFVIGGTINRKLYTYDTDIVATATATLGIGTQAEELVNITVTKAGSAYTTSPLPNISIQPPIPHRTATGYVLIEDGSLSEVVFTDRGYNYRTAPTAIIDPPLDPITATANVKTEDGGVIELELTNAGRGYKTPPSLIFSKPEPLYVPQVDEVFERNGQEWKYDGFNWRKRVSYGTVYYDNLEDDLVEIFGRESSVPVTNYEYEERLENQKRLIYVLKPEYLQIVFNDIENIMPYKKGSEQYVSKTLKRGDNPRIYE